MTITGLENDYYLCLNDIWVKIAQDNTLGVKLKVTNEKDGNSMSFDLSPINNEYSFNISLPIRALFSPINHATSTPNTAQTFVIEVSAKKNSGEVESVTIQRFFVFGRKDKHRHPSSNWHLQFGDPLYIGQWVEFKGVPNIVQPLSIGVFGTQIEYPPKSEILFCDIRDKCNAKILKFLNSIGGYSYYVFQFHEEKISVKPSRIISKNIYHLNQHSFFNSENEITRTIEFQDKTPEKLQHIIEELIMSHDVYMFVPNMSKIEDMWLRLRIEDNECVKDSYSRIFENKIKFGIE